MMKQLAFCLLVILLFAANSLAQSKRQSRSTKSASKLTVGTVDNSNNKYLDGCGCSFWTGGRNPKNDKYILLGNYDKQAWMNIDGKVVQLRLVKDTTKYQGKKGDRYYQTYQSGNLTVKVECVATGFGDTHAVFCNSNITVTKGTRKQTVKATGSCGC